MSMPSKKNRIYPYESGLKIGGVADVVIANANREPIDASQFFGKEVCVEGVGGNETVNVRGAGHNKYFLHNGMARLSTQHSYCRAYATDNVWWTLKGIVGALKKQAFMSSLPFAIKKDDIPLIAEGGISTHIMDMGIYNKESTKALSDMTYNYGHESHERLTNNIRLTVGILGLLLDQRSTAEQLRKENSPFTENDFVRNVNKNLVYKATSNFWLFSPILTHLMFGAARFAYFITVNKIEEEIWEGFEPTDVKRAIYHGDYEAGREIWDLCAARFADAGYAQHANPFVKPASDVLELLFKYGVALIGDGIYANWRMSRMKKNFKGHFRDLPSWETGSHQKIFTPTHPYYKIFTNYMEKQKNG